MKSWVNLLFLRDHYAFNKVKCFTETVAKIKEMSNENKQNIHYEHQENIHFIACCLHASVFFARRYVLVQI